MEINFDKLPASVAELHKKIDVLTKIVESQLNSAHSGNDKMLNVNEAADFLGYKPHTLYSKVHKRQIPFHKAEGGSRLYFSTKDLTEWIKNGRKKTKEEMSRELDEEFGSLKRKAK